MDSVLNLLFENWENGIPLPNGNQYGCRYPYCHEYIGVNNIKIHELEEFENVYFPIDLNSDFNCVFKGGFFSQNILSLIHNSKIKVLMLREHEGGGDHTSFFKQLNEFIICNNLPHSSFYIRFANKNLINYYNKSIGNVGINVSVSDWLLEHTSLVVNKAIKENKINDLGYKFELQTFNDIIERKYNFLCLNRVPKAHRISFLARLYKNKVIYNTDWSLLFSPYEFTPFYGDEKDKDGKNIFSIEHFSKFFDRKSLNNYESFLRYFFYTKKKSEFEPTSKNLYNFFGDTKTTHFKDSYLNSYCSLITETSYENNEEHITEKSFKPFINLHLGIFLAPYHHLHRLKSYGFKTFDQFWSEDYDEIIDVKDRMERIVEIINSLDNLNLKQLYSSAKDILLYNQNHFINFWERESCAKYFKTLTNAK